MTLLKQKKATEAQLSMFQSLEGESYDPVYDGHFINPSHSRACKTDLTVISLFTGCGGLDIGLEQAGFETSVCLEIDPVACETIELNRNWPIYKKNGGDVSKIDVNDVLEFSNLKKDNVGLVVGGAPCQPFSNIGKKEGVKSKDGNLFKEFMRFVKEAKPKGFIFENVQGMTHNKHLDILNYIEKESNKIGYSVSMRVVNAADYGVPQTRKRLIVLGLKGSTKPLFPYPTHSVNPAEVTQQYNSLGLECPLCPKPWITVKECFHNITKTQLNREDCKVMRVTEITAKRMKYIKPHTKDNFKVIPDKLLPNCWKTGKHQGGDTFGRLQLDEPSVTIRTCGYHPMKGRYIHPTEDRGLNTVELAHIQTFPQDWVFKGGLIAVGRQIGNAVPPLLAKQLGLAIKSQLS